MSRRRRFSDKEEIMSKVRLFSLLTYVETALAQADYTRDEDGVVIAQVAGAAGFFAQGDNFEEARMNLRDVIEGNVMLALQLGWAIPARNTEPDGVLNHWA